MARLPTSGDTSPEITSINLSRLIDRLQQTLFKPSATTQQRLRTSVYERSKVGANIEYARGLLLNLEQDAVNVKVLTKRHELQVELLRKRDAIEALAERLRGLNEAPKDASDDSSEGEDLLGEDTPSDDEEEEPFRPKVSVPVVQERQISTPIPQSILRSRTSQPAAQPQSSAKTTSTDTTSGTPLALSEKLLTHNRTEQETLTTSLLTMAQALNASQKAFQDSLDADTKALDRAVDSLDKNTSGLEAAQKRMGLLSRMSEGKGWWGRMMLYAWIFGLAFLAFFIVAFMPKLRF